MKYRFAFLVTALSSLLAAQDEAAQKGRPGEAAPRGAGDLEEVQDLQAQFLQSVTCVVLPEDARFLYAAAFNSDVVSSFKRDAGTGRLEHGQTITGPELDAVVSVRLSRDGKYAVASAFGSNAIMLFKRDAETGQLTFLDAAVEGENPKRGLNFVVDANFSNDNRFIYTAFSGGVGVFKVENDRLVFAHFETAGGRLDQVRGVTLSPDGTLIYATAYGSGALGVLRADKQSGALEIVQVLKDGEDGVEALAGAFRVACSRDGRHVYVSSGRFQGDQAISAFETHSSGKLKLIEEHVNGVGNFDGFTGGNDIQVSPDGTLVYALGTLSDRLVRFRRDAGSGKLTFLGSQLVGASVQPGSANLCFSPDGKFVYVADEDANSIVVLKHP
ncbi:MAG: lactonase family protein [Verrucomicrobiota bacterium]|nr:lactonase family protein [Verrucomicrobiota bacterium]